ncbi:MULTISPECIES: peptidoglycan-associated lipoprotein Pal [unclassified Methylocaldum]|jgi:peptidoglycan-associated lipoprotein|uniref:peptidoglycan-associated lipoprotein Pal n=1 Tax=unclassified Methylocaldum TaxID=2622260 RepID=UPI00098AB5CE|nr:MULTISPECIES: peptidoglycan-associated lipoprotein Pal [unclassified Methylocaldum]MBP1148735.1 peptidoglycan-associated lipoprotein [Methylocaldum sp. RMAD-M]
MKLVKTALVVAMMSLVLNGCSSKGGVQEEAGAEAGMEGGPGGPQISKYGEGTDGGAYGPGGAGYGPGAGGTGDPMLDDPSSPLSKRVIYFMYDSYEVLPEYQQVVSAHANYLASHPERNIILEGHADERGSPEYNIALGEQRAKAVAKMMQFQGANDGQVQVVSFGEEKPAVSGHDESVWQQNRRVEISYSGR